MAGVFGDFVGWLESSSDLDALVTASVTGDSYTVGKFNALYFFDTDTGAAWRSHEGFAWETGNPSDPYYWTDSQVSEGWRYVGCFMGEQPAGFETQNLAEQTYTELDNLYPWTKERILEEWGASKKVSSSDSAIVYRSWQDALTKWAQLSTGGASSDPKDIDWEKLAQDFPVGTEIVVNGIRYRLETPLNESGGTITGWVTVTEVKTQDCPPDEEEPGTEVPCPEIIITTVVTDTLPDLTTGDYPQNTTWVDADGNTWIVQIKDGSVNKDEIGTDDLEWVLIHQSGEDESTDPKTPDTPPTDTPAPDPDPPALPWDIGVALRIIIDRIKEYVQQIRGKDEKVEQGDLVDLVKRLQEVLGSNYTIDPDYDNLKIKITVNGKKFVIDAKDLFALVKYYEDLLAKKLAGQISNSRLNQLLRNYVRKWLQAHKDKADKKKEADGPDPNDAGGAGGGIGGGGGGIGGGQRVDAGQAPVAIPGLVGFFNPPALAPGAGPMAGGAQRGGLHHVGLCHADPFQDRYESRLYTPGLLVRLDVPDDVKTYPPAPYGQTVYLLSQSFADNSYTVADLLTSLREYYELDLCPGDEESVDINDLFIPPLFLVNTSDTTVDFGTPTSLDGTINAVGTVAKISSDGTAILVMTNDSRPSGDNTPRWHITGDLTT